MYQSELFEERKTPSGFTVKVNLENFKYEVYTRKGPEIPRGMKTNTSILDVPRIVFLGSAFDVSHFRLRDLNFVNNKDGKMHITYQAQGNSESKTITINSGSESDVLPVILYHFQSAKEVIYESGMGFIFHSLITDESLPKSDMINLKIRIPAINILIIKKKQN